VIWTLIKQFLGSIRDHSPNGISIGSAVFAGLTAVTDRQTDRPRRYSVCTNRPHLHIRSTAMRPNNNNWSKQLDKKAAPPPHTDGSVIFARWRQCATRPRHASLGPVHNPNGILIGSAILHSSPQFHRACLSMSFPLRIAPSHLTIWIPI